MNSFLLCVKRGVLSPTHEIASDPKSPSNRQFSIVSCAIAGVSPLCELGAATIFAHLSLSS